MLGMKLDHVNTHASRLRTLGLISLMSQLKVAVITPKPQTLLIAKHQ